MLVTKFPCLTNLLFYKVRPAWIFDQFRRLFKETNRKNWGFSIEKERGIKNTTGSTR